jgi:hypothetical protein
MDTQDADLAKGQASPVGVVAGHLQEDTPEEDTQTQEAQEADTQEVEDPPEEDSQEAEDRLEVGGPQGVTQGHTSDQGTANSPMPTTSLSSNSNFVQEISPNTTDPITPS